jgi:hypothetical protein
VACAPADLAEKREFAPSRIDLLHP